MSMKFYTPVIRVCQGFKVEDPEPIEHEYQIGIDISLAHAKEISDACDRFFDSRNIPRGKDLFSITNHSFFIAKKPSKGIKD